MNPHLTELIADTTRTHEADTSGVLRHHQWHTEQAEHLQAALAREGYSIVKTQTVEWFILEGGFFKQAGRIYSGPYVDREDAFKARNTIERIEDTHEYYIDSRPVAAAAEEDQ